MICEEQTPKIEPSELAASTHTRGEDAKYIVQVPEAIHLLKTANLLLRRSLTAKDYGWCVGCITGY